MLHINVGVAAQALKKYFLLCVAFAMLLLVAAGGFAAANNMQLNRVIAVVNGELITMYDLQQNAMPEVMRRGLTGSDRYSAEERQKVFSEVLDSMVMDILYKQEAERYMIAVEDGEVENELRRIIQSNNLDAGEFEKQIALQGMTMEVLRGRIRDNILRQRIIGAMVMRKAEVSEEDIEKYYKENYNRFSTPSSVDFSVIMLGPGRDPFAVYDEIISGTTGFADAARKYSDSPTAALGGNMGDIPLKDLNPAWREAMEGLKAGETSRPLDSGGTTILLHVNELHAGTSQSLEEVSEQIEDLLREQRLNERMEEFSGQLRTKAAIEIKI